VLYQVLTGRFPYCVTGRMRRVLDSIAQSMPTDPRKHSGEIDDEVATIVLTCLAKDAARRYQSAGELAADIRRYLAGEPIAAKRDSRWYVLRKTAARHRTPIAAVCLIMLLLAGSSAICWSLMLRARESEKRSQENLRESLLAQARARRESLAQGRRTESLTALTQAAAIRPGVDVRGEVISSLAVPDIRTRFLPTPPGLYLAAISRDGSSGVATDVQGTHGEVAIVAFPDGAVLGRIPPPDDRASEILRFYSNRRRFIRVFDRPGAQRRLEVWRVPEADLLLAITDVPDRASFDISADEQTLAVGRTDRAIHFYNMESGAETRRIELDRDPSYLRFDPTGRRLIRFHARDTDASILDIETGQSSRILEGTPIAFAAEWSPDGRLIAAAQNDLVRLWDVEQRQEVAMFAGHDTTIVYLAFSHSGRLLISEDWGGRANIWDLATLRPVLRPDIKRAVFSADDRYISGGVVNQGGSVGAIGEWTSDLPYALVAPSVTSAGARTQSGVLDPGGRIAIAAVVDAENDAHGLEFFDVRGRRAMGRIACKDVGGLLFATSDSSVFAITSGGVVRWPIRIDGATVRVGPPQLVSAEIPDQFGVSSDGKRVAYVARAGPRFKILDLADPPRVRTFETMPTATLTTVSPDGRWAFVSAWHAAGGEVWDLDAGKVVARLPISPNSVARFRHDGQLSILEFGAVSLVRAGLWSEARRVKLPSDSMKFSTSGDGRVMAGFDSHSVIHLMDLNRSDVIATFSPPDLHGFIDSALSADGATLAAFGLRGGYLQVWDLRKIRAALARMGLDWDHPQLPVGPPADAPALRLEVDSCSLVPPGRKGSLAGP